MSVTRDVPVRAVAPEGGSPNGFATMLADLLQQNMEERPEHVEVLKRTLGRVAVLVEDADVAVTIVFGGDERGAEVHSGVVGLPDVTVRAQTEDVMRMSLMEFFSRVPLPNPRGEVVRSVMERSRSGQVHIHGAMAYPGLLWRFARLMSVKP